MIWGILAIIACIILVLILRKREHRNNRSASYSVHSYQWDRGEGSPEHMILVQSNDGSVQQISDLDSLENELQATPPGNSQKN